MSSAQSITNLTQNLGYEQFMPSSSDYFSQTIKNGALPIQEQIDAPSFFDSVSSRRRKIFGPVAIAAGLSTIAVLSGCGEDMASAAEKKTEPHGVEVSKASVKPTLLNANSTVKVSMQNTNMHTRYKFVSMPDFTNADIGDLNASPFYHGNRPNSISPSYNAAFRTILGAVRREGTRDLFVAGDFVEGEWGKDPRSLGIFGPTRTVPQKRRAVKLAGSIYYPQLKQQFNRHGLRIYPAIGDHEIGDNPWSSADITRRNLHKYSQAEFDYLTFKRQNLPLFKQTFSRYYYRNPDGSLRFPNRPNGQASATAYAVRLQPEVELISLDVFRRTNDRSNVIAQVDPQQLAWLKGELQATKRDGVDWVIVQAHTPILGPVRRRHSSGLKYKKGANSPLWRLMKQYDVDLYLSGEVHDITASVNGGVTQIAHGGLMFVGESNYLVGDIKGDTMRLTTKEFVGGYADESSGKLTCINRDGYCPARVIYYPNRKPRVTGRIVIKNGRSTPVSRSGRLAPYRR